MDVAVVQLSKEVEALRAQVAAAHAREAAARQRNDAAALQVERLEAEAASLATQRQHLEAEVARLTAENARWEHIVAQLRRLAFGKSSERLDPAQLQLGLEDLETARDACEAVEEKGDPELKTQRTRQRRDRRPSLPDHLPQIEVVIEPASTACPCCSGAMHRIGEDVSKRLDVVPVQYQVLVTRRPKYACRACEGAVVQAPAPARLIEGGLPTERLVAQVLTAKYADHTPLFRQAQGLARQGIKIDRSTLAFWTGYAAAELKPLWRLMRDQLLASSRLFVDETRAPVLDPGRGRTKTGYFWAIARDDRSWGGQDPPAVVYTYAPGRGHDHAIALLADFSGVLQTDGYSAYRALARKRNDVVLAPCWAHVRRKVFDLAKAGNAPIAEETLRRIGELYEVEATVRGQGPDARLAARRATSRPVVDALEAWLKDRLREVPGRSPMAEAIRYALTRWDGLVRFLDDGHLELDTNPVERAMRPIALGRKNHLFAGSDEGAEHWAVIATLVECCKLRGLNVQTYLEDVITRLVNGHPQAKLAELTPWNWAPPAKA